MLGWSEVLTLLLDLRAQTQSSNPLQGESAWKQQLVSSGILNIVMSQYGQVAHLVRALSWLIHQGWRFDHQSAHTEEWTNEYITKWNKKSIFLPPLPPLSISLSLSLSINKNFSPGWCGSVDWAPAYKPKGHWFCSHSGHMPGLGTGSGPQWGGVWDATIHWCFSLFLPSSPSLKIKK